MPQVLVIGSGITGLCTGALLSEAGYEVVVLEGNAEYFGGHARIIKKGGYEFCAGPQYVWDFDKGKIGNRVLTYLGLEKEVLFADMDRSAYEQVYIGNEAKFNFHLGLKQLEASLCDAFSSKAQSIRDFFSFITHFHNVSRFLTSSGVSLKEKGLKMKWEVLKNRDLSFADKFNTVRFSNRSINDLFRICGIDGELRRVLFGHGGIFAENFYDLSAVMYAGATGSYSESAQFPVKGFGHLVDSLISKIEKNGAVLRGKKVTKLTHSRDRITGALCEDGTQYTADLVISNLTPRHTFRLIDPGLEKRFRYEPSNPLIGCYLGIKGYDRWNDKLARKNIWWYPDADDADYQNGNPLQTPKMLYVGSPTQNARQLHQQDASRDSVITFVPGSFALSEEAFNKGPQHYAEYKKKISDVVVNTLDANIFPNIAGNVELAEVVTPFDLSVDFGQEKGSVYGRRLTAKSILDGVGEIADFKNLHIGCATVGYPGILPGFNFSTVIFEKITGTKI